MQQHPGLCFVLGLFDRFSRSLPHGLPHQASFSVCAFTCMLYCSHYVCFIKRSRRAFLKVVTGYENLRFYQRRALLRVHYKHERHFWSWIRRNPTLIFFWYTGGLTSLLCSSSICSWQTTPGFCIKHLEMYRLLLTLQPSVLKLYTLMLFVEPFLLAIRSCAAKGGYCLHSSPVMLGCPLPAAPRIACPTNFGSGVVSPWRLAAKSPSRC